jgi:hypothetical protein
MSKVDPRKLSNVSSLIGNHHDLTDLFDDKVDERTTLLLEAAKQESAPKASRELDAKSHTSALSSPRRRLRTMSSRSQARSTTPIGVSNSPTDLESGVGQVWDPTLAGGDSSDTEDEEVIVEKTEQPGIDSLRGTFGAVGTIIRNRRRTVLSEARDRSRTRNRRGSEASGLASQSINEEPRQPGEERDPEKPDLGHKHFGSRTRKPPEPATSALPSVPPPDTRPQGTLSILSASSVEPVLHASPESEKSDPLTASPRRAPILRAHFDPNQQSPNSRLQTLSLPPASNNTDSVRSRADRADQDLEGGEEKLSST